MREEADLISNCDHISKKTISFDDIAHFIDEEDIAIYVDCDYGKTFYAEARIKVGKINRELKNISRSCEKPMCIPSNNQYYRFIDKEHTSLINLRPYNLWDTNPAALKLLNHTIDGDSMWKQYPQRTTQRHTTDFFRHSIYYKRWTVNETNCASALSVFRKITYLTDEWVKQLLRLKN